MEKYEDIERLTRTYIETLSDAISRDYGLSTIERAAFLYYKEIERISGSKPDPVKIIVKDEPKPKRVLKPHQIKGRNWSVHMRSSTAYMIRGRDKIVRIMHEYQYNPDVISMTSKQRNRHFGANNQIIKATLLPRITMKNEAYVTNEAIHMYTTSAMTFEVIASELGVCLLDIKDILLKDNNKKIKELLSK